MGTIEDLFREVRTGFVALGKPVAGLRVVHADINRIRAKNEADFQKWRASVQQSLDALPVSEVACRKECTELLRRARPNRAVYVLDYVYNYDQPMACVGRWVN